MNYKILYSNVINLPADRTRPTSKTQNGSRAFISAPLKRRNALKDIFGIGKNDQENQAFDIAFEQVTNGKGYELKRIMTVHSSALLGLLLFFNVNQNNPICINGKEYTKVYFEVESKVYGSNSSIDIMLVSDEKNEDEPTLLFLELKFTEFLSPTFQYWIKKKYFELYSQIQSILATADICVGNVEPRTHSKDGLLYTDEEFNISKKGCSKQYFEGIKQMISHLIGLINNPASGNNVVYDTYIKNKKPHIILGTMLYDPSHLDNEFKELFDNYVDLYKKVFSTKNNIVEAISRHFDCNPSHKIEVLDAPLTYQKDLVFKKISPYLSNVKEIYRL